MNQDKIEQIKVLDTLTNQSHTWKKNTSKISKSIIDLAILAENQKLRNCPSYFRNERNEVLEDENEIMSDRMHFTKHEKSKIRKYIVDSAVCCVKCFSIFKNFCSENGCTYSFIRDIYVKIVKYALKLDNGISLCAALEIYKHDWELLKHSEVQGDWFDVMNKQVIGTYMFEKCTFSLFFLLMSDMNGKKYFLTSICNQYTNNSLFLHTTEQEWTFIVDLYKNKFYKKENSDIEIDLLSFILSYLTIEGTFANDDIAKLLVSHYNSCTTEFVKFFIFKIAYLLNKKLTKPCDKFKQIFEDVLDLNHTVKIYKNVITSIKEKLLLIQQDIFYLVDALSMFVYYECDIKFYSAAKEIRNDLVLRELYINIASLTLFTNDTSAFITNFNFFEDILYSYATDPIYKNKGTGFVKRVAALLIDLIFDKNNVDIETKYTVLLKWNSAISKMNQTYKRQFNYSELSIFCEYCFYDLYNDLANTSKKLADIHKSFVNNLIRLFEKMDEKQICERYRIYFLIITSKYTTYDYCPIDPLIIDKIVLFHAKYGYIPNTFYKLLHFLLGYPFDEQLFQQLLNLLKMKSVADSAIEICINMLQKIDVNLTKSFLVYCDRKIKHLNTDRANTLRDLLADLYNENENLGDTFEDEAMSTTSSIDIHQKSESDEDLDELQNSMKNDFGTKSDDTKSELTDSETKEVDSDSVPTKNRESTPPSVVDSSSFIVDERIDESEAIESEMSTESKNTSQSAENETCDEETQEVNESSDECKADQDNDEETQEVNESSDEHQVDQAKEEEEEKLSSQGNEECLLENDRSKELNYITDNRAREDIINSNKLIDNENSVHQSDSDIEEIDNSANKIRENEVTKSLPLDFFVSSENETSEKVKKLKTNGSFNTHMNVEPSKISVTPWKTANVDGIKYLSLKKKREDSPSPVIIRNSNSDRNTVPKPFATTYTCNFGALNEFTTKRNIDFDRQMMQNSYKTFNPKPLINKSSKVYIDSIKDLEDNKLRAEPHYVKIGSQIAKQDNMQEPSQTVKSTFNPYSYTKKYMLPPRQSDSNKKNVSNNADIYHAILSAKGPLKTIESKKIKFCDFESYRQYFNPLIINEILANIEKGLSEMNRNEVNFIKFSYVEKGTHLDEIYFNFDKCNLCENDAILVINKKDKNNIENVCIVKAVNNPMKIVKVLVAKENNTFSKYGDYTYCYIASLNTYFREYTAIQTLKDYSHLQDIISPVHDKGVIIDEAVKNEVQSKLNINEYQAGAVAHCVNTARRIALIQGPPGTGKTTTIVSLISAFYSGLFKFDKFGDKQRILICAPSNTAIDEVARRILKNGVKLLDDTIFMPNLLRVGVSNNISPEIRNITFEHMFEQNEIKNTHHRETERVKILNNCDIVLSTLSSSTHDCLFSIRMNFELIIVDEACQSVELSTILPLKHRHKKMVLIGDPMQLTPTTISPSQLYSMSLYQRLLNFLPIFMLGIQYRMTNLIAEFPSSHFYGGLLKTDKSCQNRVSPFKAPFPEIAFVNIIGKEIRNKTNGFSNQKEVFALIKFLYTLHEQKSFTFAKNIAIITPYKTQAFLITATLKKMISEKKIDRNILKHVEINTVDAFQGQEKDLVIISTVRTKNIGFINDASRMNVMLTRAKFSVVIFGNSQFLAKDKLWMKLLCFYGANDAISSENKFMEFIENFNK